MADKKIAAKAAPTINLDTDLDDSAIDKALAEGQRTTGGFDGPAWVPMLHEKWNEDLKPERLAEKVAKAGAGSTARQKISGALVAAFAWGRRLYFLDVATTSGAIVRVKLPEHKGLYAGLNLWPLGTQIACELEGKGSAKPGRQAPWRFAVSGPTGRALAEPRADALEALSMEERETALDRAKGAPRAGAEGKPPGAGGDDIPF